MKLQYLSKSKLVFAAVAALVLLVIAVWSGVKLRGTWPGGGWADGGWTDGGGLPRVWFDDLRAPLTMDDTELARLTELTAAAVRERADSIAGLAADDTQPRMVFASVSDSQTPARIVLGVGNGLSEALNNVVSLARRTLPADYSPRWIKLDYVVRQRAALDVDRNTMLVLDESLYGIAFARRSRIALLPEEIMANGLVDELGFLKHDTILGYLAGSPLRSAAYREYLTMERLPLVRFETRSFFSESNASPSVPLYRGQRHPSWISADDLLKAARRGGDYLVRSTHGNGQFDYSYLPVNNLVERDYNIVRHAGTVYSMLELYGVTKDDVLLGAAQRAADYLVRRVKPAIDTDGAMCVVFDGETSLGVNALAAIALAEFAAVTKDQKHEPIMLALGEWILGSQAQTGEFIRQKQIYPDGKVEAFRSANYPGEAILALLRIHAQHPRRKWIEAADKAALFLIEERDADLADDELPHDHWLLYGLNDLYLVRPRPQFRRHALRVAEAIVRAQNVAPDKLDWLGSFLSPPRVAPTARRLEGLCAAYHLAGQVAAPEVAESILAALRLGTGFLLQLQCRPESVMYYSNPLRPLGGFRAGLKDSRIGIDIVQHTISGLLGVYRITGGTTTAVPAVAGETADGKGHNDEDK